MADRVKIQEVLQQSKLYRQILGLAPEDNQQQVESINRNWVDRLDELAHFLTEVSQDPEQATQFRVELFRLMRNSGLPGEVPDGS